MWMDKKNLLILEACNSVCFMYERATTASDVLNEYTYKISVKPTSEVGGHHKLFSL